jgi:two-component system cell cycle sensor histidine kinase/response regulator CckA
VRIIHIEDSLADAELVGRILLDEWPECEIVRVATGEQLTSQLETDDFDLILSDFTLGSFDGLSALEISQKLRPSKPFIFLSGTIGEDRAVDALKNGASDYVLKDRMARLVPAIRRALAQAKEAEEARHNEQSLRRSEERIREQAALLAKAQDGILACDLTNRITFWNEGAERLYGWSSAEAAGCDVVALLSTDPFRHDVARSQAIALGDWRGELKHRTKSGAEVTVDSGWTLIRRQTGVDSLLVINTDITERKRIEAHFFRAQRTECLGLIAGGVAHDLNNVLAPILLSLDLLRPAQTDPDMVKVIDHISLSARHGAALIKELLSFAKGVGGQHVEIDLRAFVSDWASFIRSTLPRSIRVTLEFKSEAPLVRADTTQLKQVLINLCINARDAMPEGGKITLGLDCLVVEPGSRQPHPDAVPGTYAVLTVSDTGTGIEPAILDRIFDPFFTTKEPGKGTGLGLSTVRGIVKGHRGFLTVDSQLGRGTEFRIHLPRAATGRTKETAAVRGEGILLLDDDPGVRMILEMVLSSAGYRIFPVAEGLSALEIFTEKRSEIQLAITDLNLEGLSGREFIERIRKVAPNLPILGISGLAVGASPDEDLASNGIHVLAKPIEREALLNAVRTALGREVRAG